MSLTSIPWKALAAASMLVHSALAVVTVPTSSSARPGLLSSYVSFSIELEGFPYYAGNSSVGVNQYSINLSQNLGDLMGSMPVVRVGGNTADWVSFDSSQTEALDFACSTGRLCMGPSFFDSYKSFPNTKFTHGLNMVANNASGFASLQQQIAHGCKTLEGKFETWEYGNEVDLYIGGVRPSDWNEADNVSEWTKGTQIIKGQLHATCPSLATPANLHFSAPNLAGVPSKLDPVKIFSDGLDSNDTITRVTVHNYMGIASSPGTSLQGTLMNHQKNVAKLNEHANSAKLIANVPGMSSVPYIIGEQNSLAGGGAVGISNTLGAALWGLDFVLQAASTNVIKRVHFHTNAGAPYAPWDPATPTISAQTWPPYYGHMAAAKFMGQSQSRAVSDLQLDLNNSSNSAYAGYDTETGALDRLAVINLQFYSSTSGGARGKQSYQFSVMPSSSWSVDRLRGAGAQSTAGVTFGGYAYEFSTLGKPRLVGKSSEILQAGKDGLLTLTLSDSEAAIVSLV